MKHIKHEKDSPRADPEALKPKPSGWCPAAALPFVWQSQGTRVKAAALSRVASPGRQARAQHRDLKSRARRRQDNKPTSRQSRARASRHMYLPSAARVLSGPPVAPRHTLTISLLPSSFSWSFRCADTCQGQGIQCGVRTRGPRQGKPHKWHHGQEPRGWRKTLGVGLGLPPPLAQQGGV